jgi:tetratricopeptide (TPR) repeat protein
MLRELTAIVAEDPRDARAQLGLAEACLRQFDQAQQASDNPLSLAAVRDAAIAGGFRSREDLQTWLSRALGPRRTWLDKALWHTHEALALCPLQGQGYLYLAELSFLDRADRQTPAALINQALAVRPHDGGVLFKAGEEAALAGNESLAIEYWKQAFHAGPITQWQLIDYFVRRKVPPAFVLEHFAPDRAALRLLYQRYHDATAAEEFRPLVEHYARVAMQDARQVKGPPAAPLWLEAHRLAAELQDHEQALRCAKLAVAADENNLDVRLMVGRYLFMQKQYREAEQHLSWCLARRPDDKRLRADFEAATKGRIDTQTQAAARHALRQ